MEAPFEEPDPEILTREPSLSSLWAETSHCSGSGHVVSDPRAGKLAPVAEAPRDVATVGTVYSAQIKLGPFEKKSTGGSMHRDRTKHDSRMYTFVHLAA